MFGLRKNIFNKQKRSKNMCEVYEKRDPADILLRLKVWAEMVDVDLRPLKFKNTQIPPLFPVQSNQDKEAPDQSHPPQCQNL